MDLEETKNFLNSIRDIIKSGYSGNYNDCYYVDNDKQRVKRENFSDTLRINKTGENILVKIHRQMGPSYKIEEFTINREFDKVFSYYSLTAHGNNRYEHWIYRTYSKKQIVEDFYTSTPKHSKEFFKKAIVNLDKNNQYKNCVYLEGIEKTILFKCKVEYSPKKIKETITHYPDKRKYVNVYDMEGSRILKVYGKSIIGDTLSFVYLKKDSFDIKESYMHRKNTAKSIKTKSDYSKNGLLQYTIKENSNRDSIIVKYW